MSRLLPPALLLCALAAALVPPATAKPPAPSPGLRAGAFAQEVTPTAFPISVSGNLADVQAKSAHDPLHARCLVLDDGKTKVALVVVDSCMIPRDLIDAAKTVAEKTTGIPAANVMISATHTHTAPTLGGVFQSEPNAGYVAFLTAKIAEGIDKAHARLAPAKAGWGGVPVPNHVYNRRWRTKPGVVNKDPFGGTTDRVKTNPGFGHTGLDVPAGGTDPEVSVLSLRGADDRPLALYANYSLHYVGDRPALSADYFGVFADRVGGLLGARDPGFVGLLSNGTSGDANNVDFTAPAPAKRVPGERSREVAEAVGGAAKGVAGAAAYRADITLAVAEKELELKVRKPTAADLKRAADLLAKAAGRELKPWDEIYARETVLLAKYPDTVKLKIQAIRVADLGVVGIPCEVFAETGLVIKKKSPLPRAFTVSLANGYNGYLPTPAQHALGGYETWRARSSYLDVNASEPITAAALELLAAVA